MGMANGTADVGAPPAVFGRYTESRRRQWRSTLLLALLMVAPVSQVLDPAAGQTPSGWGIAAFVCACVVFVTMLPVTWLVALTVIDERGIRRAFSRPRHIDWDEITNLSVADRGRFTWVYAHLGDGRKVRLVDVPAAAVPGLLNQIGIAPPPASAELGEPTGDPWRPLA
jgi:hypothetical protein